MSIHSGGLHYTPATSNRSQPLRAGALERLPCTLARIDPDIEIDAAGRIPNAFLHLPSVVLIHEREEPLAVRHLDTLQRQPQIGRPPCGANPTPQPSLLALRIAVSVGVQSVRKRAVQSVERRANILHGFCTLSCSMFVQCSAANCLTTFFRIAKKPLIVGLFPGGR